MRLWRIAVLTGLLIAVFDIAEIRDAGLARPGDDYACLWTAGHQALDGAAAQLYDPARFLAAVQAQVPAYRGVCAYFYPPPALLLQAPFALLPEAASQAAWLLAGAAFLAAVIAGLGGGLRGAVGGLLHPAVTINLSLGQNGLLSGALIGLALGAASPALAGLALAGLGFKPHLAAAVALCLLVQRRWRTLAWAALGGAGLGLASLACFGAAPWQGFLALGRSASPLLDEAMHSFIMQGSIFRSLAVAGLPEPACLVLQGAGAAAGLALAWRAARRGDRLQRLAATIAALPLILPRFGTYDLAFLAVPAALLWRCRRPATQASTGRLVLLWTVPLFAQVAAAAGFHIVPLLSLLLAAACLAEGEVNEHPAV